MKKFKLNKLVRDRILDLNEKAGVKSNYQILDDEEYIKALIAKIKEESAELFEANKKSLVKELSDLQEVIDCTVEALGVSREDFKMYQNDRRDKKGSFKKRIFIDTVDVPDDSKWVQYYRETSDRHPEVK